MAETRFEQFHVPQQSRRDKLRVNQPTFLDPDFVGSAPRFTGRIDSKENVPVSEFMGYAAGNMSMNMMMGSSSSPANCLYADPPMNPSQIQDIAPFLYNNIPFHGGAGDMMVYRPPEQVCGDHQAPNSNGSSCQGLSLSLNLQRYDSSGSMCGFPGQGGPGPGDGGSSSGEMVVSRSSVQLGPFTGYASILKGSRFLKPAQLLLGELCDVGSDFYVEKINVGSDSILLDPVPSPECFSGEDEESSKKKTMLISMLNEVHRRYKQYCQQMQLVIASFESVAGVRNAAPFAILSLKSMSKNFSCLKTAITDQLQMIIEPPRGHAIAANDQDCDTPRSGMHFPGPPQITGYTDQPVWRPQRGLPERAVTVLRSWLFDHFLHPYPTDTDKLMLAKQTGLSRNQVSNWFINARVRLWKPMVEEIHMLETKQGDNSKQKDGEVANDNGQNGHFPPPPGVITPPENDVAVSKKRGREIRQKRARDESELIVSENDHIINSVPYENPFHQGRSSSGVSLTLGLYQNNNVGLGLPEPYPMSAARRFGLDGSGAGGFSGGVIHHHHQNRHGFGREIVGGQLLHDFVG